MQDFYFAIYILFTLFLVGYGITAFLIPQTLKKYGLWFSPWIGTIIVILLNVSASLGMVPVSISSNIFLLFFFLTIIYAFFLKKQLVVFSKYNIVFSIFILFCFLVFPYFMQDLDIKNKIIESEYFYKSTLVTKLNEKKTLSLDDFNISSSMVISFINSIYKNKIKDIMPPLSLVYISLLFPLFSALINNIHKSNNLFFKTILYFLLLVFIKFFIHSLDTVLYVGIVSMIILFLIQYFSFLLKNSVVVFKLENFDILLAISLASLTVITPAFFKYLFLIFIVVIAIVLFYSKRKINILFALSKIIFLTFLINPLTVGIALGIR